MKTTEFIAWENIRKRYDVCKRWDTFAHFLVDMGKKPTSEHIFQRIDKTKPCGKANCKWGTGKNNLKLKVFYHGKIEFASDLFVRFGLKNKNQFLQRIKRGWAPDDARDETPVRVKQAPKIAPVRNTRSIFPPGFGFAAYSPKFMAGKN